MAEFINIFNEENLLIYLQNEPCLYDITKRDYHDRLMKQNAWERIAQKLNSNGKLFTILNKIKIIT